MQQRHTQLITLEASQGAAVRGIAARFGTPDRFGDVLLPGCFDKSLARGEHIAMLLNHSASLPAGRWTGVTATPAALEVAGELAVAAPHVKAVLPVVEMGAMGLSVGFFASDGGAKRQGDGSYAFAECDLIEVSITALPAGRGTELSLKQCSVRDLEELLHADGFSNREAKARAKALHAALHGGSPDEPDPQPQDLSALAEQVRRMNRYITKGR